MNIGRLKLLQCRGLITDKEGNVVARPFSKFFNLQQHKDPLPIEDYEVCEKLDGSLGILYFFEGMPYIATKGNFVSKQAIKANEMLYSIYKNSIPLLDKNLTYLFEIVYPSNRIVVDYGDIQSLTLLGMIHTSSGEEIKIDPSCDKILEFPVALRHWDPSLLDLGTYKPMSLEMLRETLLYKNKNTEGFVIRFASGLRLKAKLDEYLQLHKFIADCTSKKIWEIVKEADSFDKIIEKVPDELFKWIKKTEQSFKDQYNLIEQEAKREFINIIMKMKGEDFSLGDDVDFNTLHGIEDIVLTKRKEFAQLASSQKHAVLLFRMLDKKDYSEFIWQMIKPKKVCNFMNNINYIQH